ncbi:FERM domain-containing protein 5 isoform X5 [Leptopilina heterotoma]|uniref:FERM domain-containing protein 5 isoform X5 n=1 Tax=Leptopilina heterotoma TaxID=63436 RepID=UPI001CA86BAC|nr:FERM domain-containing protein 5 isoform X5 [Leptopilina heterotoma]
MLKFGSKSDVTVVHRATIRLLDDAEILHCDFQPQDKGRHILEYVCKQLNILETDYFGLRYVDHCRQRHWLDLAKTVVKQIKDMDPILFSFRVKFYPPDPLRLKEEITRYQIYQQLKRDLLHGRLYCSPGEASLLAACIVQSELGDYDPEIHESNYISEHKLLLKQTETIEEKAMDLHQTQLKGFTPEQAETHFLRLASQLDTYAVDPHPVKDHKGTQLYLGINHSGILTFQGSRKTNHFRWSEVQKINYEGKMFIVHLTINEDTRTKIRSVWKCSIPHFQKKHTVGFKCPTGSNCRHVWRCAIEQMLFFTLPRASDAPVLSGGSIFSWGTKFKYTGRTEREVLEEAGPLRNEEPPIQRCHSTGLRRKASSVPATPSTPSQDLVEIRYSSLPRSCHSAGLDGAGMADIASGVPLSSPYCPDNTLPLLETVSEDQEIHTRRNNALNENESHASDTHSTSTFTTTNQAKIVKFPKSTLNRPQPLYSQKIIIGSDELTGNIESIVKQKIDSLDKSPKVVRSTALIIKTSKTPSKCKTNGNLINNNNNNGNAITCRDNNYSQEKIAINQNLSPSNWGQEILRNVGNGIDAIKRHYDSSACQHEGDANDYYFRDSFDHSSSDNQLMDATGKTHNRQVTPVPKMQKLQNTKISSQSRRNGVKIKEKSLRVVKLLIPAFMITITVIFIAIVLIFETDSNFVNSLRKTPEMVALQNQFYVPIKEFLKSKLGLF